MGIIMSTFVLLNWVVVALCIRLAEYQWNYTGNSNGVVNYLDCLWMSIITFMTIGYGDFYPASHYGRFFAVSLGFSGAISTAILISVMTDWLQMSRRERLLHATVLGRSQYLVFYDSSSIRVACIP